MPNDTQHKWTKGPWKQATRGPNGCPIIGDNKGVMIAMLTTGLNFEDQSEANAHLIASAPDLYAALEDIYAGCVSVYGSGEDKRINVNISPAAFKAMEISMAKARGESNG